MTRKTMFRAWVLAWLVVAAVAWLGGCRKTAESGSTSSSSTAPAPPPAPSPQPASPPPPVQISDAAATATAGAAADEPGQLDQQVRINSFPSPVPPPSAETSPLTLMFVKAKAGHTTTFGDVEDALRDLIDAAGYDWRQFYAFPGGFAMVTRVEQTRPDWTPMPPPNRWAVNVGEIKNWSIAEVVRRFASAPSGFYQVLVFIVTDQPVVTSGKQATYSDLTSKLPPGADRLPSAISTRNTADGTRCTVLIYEFRKADGQDAAVVVPGSISARDHLQRSALWAGLAGAP
ncbi:hypothetical protein [Caballeronia insecticola]|nr:hypothetical protein [Caballeronia insecticola]